MKFHEIDGHEINGRYERLRRHMTALDMTEGDQSQGAGLGVLHQRGLHAWIKHVIAEPPSRWRAEVTAVTPGREGLDVPELGRSPLVGLCTDMLLATLSLQGAR